jgi:hypothetical protein
MNERRACEHLKQRFEQAGFRIADNVDYAAHGLRFDLDGFDAAAGVGYEYITAEAGDGWDVDEAVIAKLADLQQRGELHVLVVDEDDAPDAASLDRAVDQFLADLKDRGVTPDGGKKPATKTETKAKAGAKPPPTPKAARKPKPKKS